MHNSSSSRVLKRVIMKLKEEEEFLIYLAYIFGVRKRKKMKSMKKVKRLQMIPKARSLII